MKCIIKLLLTPVFVFILALVSLVAYLSFTEYRPAKIEMLFLQKDEKIAPLNSNKTFKAMIWNIGFAGFDKSQDFFYDGGTKVRPSYEQAVKNINDITKTIQNYTKNVDFLLLQEVDKQSKRSHYIDEVALLQRLKNHSDFAFNYKVKYVPLPVFEPLGYVESGLMSLSNHYPTKAIRHSFPSSYAFPKNLAFLKRAFLEQRFALDNGKELIIINTHNSAYDNGSLKKAEMDLLKEFLTKEYQKGNYIVVGGDWNQIPFDFVAKFKNDAVKENNQRISQDFMPNWQFAYDNTTPTNRMLDMAYQQGKTKTSVIDFFLVSPNIKASQIQNLDLSFESSDHNPSILEFELK